jgi:hypothetical protein
MNKRNLIVLPLVAIALASCGNNQTSTSYVDMTIKTICPAGAPALAFYDKGNDENFETNSTPTNVLAQFALNNYNAIVFDSVSGLRSIKKNGYGFRAAKFITGGNYYIASINKAETDSPQPTDKIVSFGENLLPDLVFKKLYNQWSWQSNVSYVKSVSDVQGVLKSGVYAGANVDYVMIAQPALNAAMLDTTADTYGKVKIYKNLRQEWQTLTGQTAIPQAALFYRYSDYLKNPTAFNTYTNEMETRITTAIDNPAAVKTTLDEYGDNAKQANRFGFASPIMFKTQNGGANGFGLVRDTENIDVNDFLEALGLSETYDSNYFI